MKKEKYKPENVVYIKSLYSCDTYRCDFCSSDKDLMYNEITDVHTCGDCVHETIVSDLSTYIQNYAKDFANQRVVKELEGILEYDSEMTEFGSIVDCETIKERIKELKQKQDESKN